jgi:hypothetical protein
MAELNNLACASNVANVGFGTCYLDLKQIVGAIIVPNGYELTSIELASLQASLVADSKAANKLSRIYPIHKIVGVTANTEEKTVQTFSTGAKAVVREGKYDWTFQFVEGGLCLSNALRSFNSNGAWSILFYDEKYVLFGRKGSTAGSLYGIPTNYLWAQPFTPNDGSNTAIYAVNVVFNPEYINEQLGYVQATSTIEDVKGLQDVNITVNSWVEATGVGNVTVMTDCGTNLGEVYPTELVDADVWIANNASTGAAITVSTRAYVSSTKTFNITVDTADSDFPTGTQGVLLNVAANSVLEANGIVGFESSGAVTLPTTA